MWLLEVLGWLVKTVLESVVRLLVFAGVLALVFWACSRYAAPPPPSAWPSEVSHARSGDR